MRSNHKTSKPIFLIVGLISVIALAYSYYFFIYVRNNEKAIMETAYRRLENINQNITDKAVEYQGRFSTNFQQVLERDALVQKRDSLRLQMIQSAKQDIDGIRAGLLEVNQTLDKLSIGEPQTHMILCASDTVNRDYFSVVEHHDIGCEENQDERFSASHITDEYYLKISLPEKYSLNYPLGDFLEDVLKSSYFGNLALLHCSDTKCISPFSDGIKTVYSSDLHYNSINELINKSKSLYDSNFFRNTALDITYQGKDYRLMIIPAEVPEENLYLMALVDLGKIKQQARAIDPALVLFLGLALIILVIAYPFIKLKFLDKNERLGISDLYILGTSTILGFALIQLMIIVLSNRESQTYHKSANYAQSIAEEIQREFVAELDLLKNDLEIFNRQYEANSENNPGSINVEHAKYFKKPKDLAHESAVFFRTNKDADILLIVSGETYLNTNVSGRQYFQDAINNRRVDIDSSLSINGLESVYSYSSSTPELILSLTAYEGDSISGISAIASDNVQMLFDPILPPGIKFAFIDPSGKALIHSDKHRNNRENLFEEITGSDAVRDLVMTRSKGSVAGKYYDSEHVIHVRPIDGLDWSLVVLKDMTNEKIREFSITTYLLTLTLLWFFLIILITLVVRVSTSRKTLLKKKIFAYNWLLPRKDESIYIRKVIFNTLLIGFQIIAYFFIQDLLVALFIHLQAIVLTSATNFYLLYQVPKSKFCSENSGSPAFRVHLTIHTLLFLLFSGMLIVYVNYIAGLISVAVTILLLFLLFRINIRNPRLRFAGSYNLFLYSWLIAVTLVPTTSYYTIISDKVTRSWELANAFSLSEQIENYAKNQEPLVESDSSTIRKWVQGDTMLVSISLEKKKKNDSVKHQTAENSFIDGVRVNHQFLFSQSEAFPLSQLDRELRTDKFIFEESDDGKNGLTTLFSNRDENINALSVVIQEPYYDKTLPRLMVFLLMSVFLILSYRVINMISTRALNKGLDDLFIKTPVRFQDLSHISAELKNLFFTSFEEDAVEEWAKETWPDVIVLNFQKTIAASTVSAINNGEAETYLITGLDYNLINSSKVVERLKLIDELNAQKRKRIIVISPVELEFIFDHYNKRMFDANDPVAAHDLMELKDQWESIFKNYSQIHIPLAHDLPEETTTYNTEFDAIIAHETHHGTHLRSLQILVNPDVCKDDRSLYISCCEKVIIQVQMLADAFYHNLWNNCTDSEKLLLYDLADDGVLNSSDSISLKNLYQKGLIVSGAKEGSHTPSIFNYSFSNFILESNIHKEAEALEKEFRKRGKWKNYSAVIITIIVALVTFFVFAEPHQLKKVNSVIAIMVAAIPGVIRIGQTLFSFSLTKPGSK